MKWLRALLQRDPAQSPEMVSVEGRLAAAEARIKLEERQYSERLKDKRMPKGHL